MTNEQSATLLRLNKQAQVAALNAVGFSDVTENSRASEFGQRIKWAAGLLDLHLACNRISDNSKAYFTAAEWNSLTLANKQLYIKRGLRIRAHGHSFVIAAQECYNADMTTTFYWGGQGKAIDGLRQKGLGAMYGCFTGEEDTDLIITGRGGGSMEDLWAFNDERVARAIYDSDIPVISAVGHEPDVAISDFVADRRASTPSNAAEIAVPDMAELLRTLDAAHSRMTQSIRRDIATHSRRLESLSKKRVLTDPTAYLADRRQDVDHMTHRLCAAMRVVTDVQNRRFGALAASLDALSPLKVLGRGYALAQRPDGTVLRSADQARIGETLRLRLADGALRCQVKEKENEHGSKKDV